MITIYDALMLLIVIISVLQGAWRGMAWQLAPIASLVLGYIVSYPLSTALAEYFGKPPLNRLWAMIAIYLVVSLFVYMVARSIRHSLERMKLVEFDRHLGAVFGGIKGVLFTVVLTLGLVSVSDQARELILKSESSTISARLMNTISPILPQPLNDLVHPYLKNLNDQLPEIADNPTYTLPAPPVLIPNRIANQQSLAKPKRFQDFGDDFPAPIRPEDDFSTPGRTPAPANDNFDFPAMPDPGNRKPPSRTPLSSTPPADFFDDPFQPPTTPRPATGTPTVTPQPTPERNPPRDPLPPKPPADDPFFGADPDAAFKKAAP